MGKALTLTVIAHMTSNYGEGLGNISSVQKVFRNGKTYPIRSRESLKNAIMIQSGFYDDLKVTVDGATQKMVEENCNAANCRALEGGYMNTGSGTKGKTYIRNSSFYLTDAVACEEYVNETRFHNNLFMAQTCAKEKGLNLQENPSECGLMPYQYEYDKSLKVYSMTIDLDMIGKDQNFNTEAEAKEKADRVNALLTAVENLHMIVKGNLDNAEPVFVVGGISDVKTHVFENVVAVKKDNLVITEDLKDKLAKGYETGILLGDNFRNEQQVKDDLNAVSVPKFFDDLRSRVNQYYEV